MIFNKFNNFDLSIIRYSCYIENMIEILWSNLNSEKNENLIIIGIYLLHLSYTWNFFHGGNVTSVMLRHSVTVVKRYLSINKMTGSTHRSTVPNQYIY